MRRGDARPASVRGHKTKTDAHTHRRRITCASVFCDSDAMTSWGLPGPDSSADSPSTWSTDQWGAHAQGRCSRPHPRGLAPDTGRTTAMNSPRRLGLGQPPLPPQDTAWKAPARRHPPRSAVPPGSRANKLPGPWRRPPDLSASPHVDKNETCTQRAGAWPQRQWQVSRLPSTP